MDASNTGEARMSEGMSFPKFSPDFEKKNESNYPLDLGRESEATITDSDMESDSEATITDSDQSSISSIDDDEGGEIEFNTSEKSGNATVSDCIIQGADLPDIFIKVSPIIPKKHKDDIIADIYNSLFFLEWTKTNGLNDMVMNLTDVRYVEKAEWSNKYKTVKHKTPDVALIYICEKGGIINPYDVIESEYHATASACVQRFVHFLKTCSRDSGMMHNDLHNGNVMFDPETNSLTLIDYGRVTFYNGWETTLNTVITNDVLIGEPYMKHVTGRHDALPPVQYAHAKSFPDQAMHKYRYVPDLMAFSMYLYDSIVERYPIYKLPFFEKTYMDGIWITNENYSTTDITRIIREHIEADDLLTPIMEGIFNYAIYTLDLEEVVRSIFFHNYTPTGEGSGAMQEYLETIASIQTDYDSMFGDSATEERHLKALGNWRTQEDDNGMRAARAFLLMGGTIKPDLSEFFPTSLSEAYSTKWRRKPKIQRTNRQVASSVLKHSVPSQSVLVAGGKKTQSLPVCTWLMLATTAFISLLPR
jgi:hypothetical protein